MFLEGLRICEMNAEKLMNDAEKAFEEELYSYAYFLGFTSREEFGKALLFIKYWNENLINKNTWHKEFRKHEPKIIESGKVTDYDLLDEIKKIRPNANIILLGPLHPKKEFLRLFNLRNDTLLVGFNFDEQKWKSPFNIKDIEQEASEMIRRAKNIRKDLSEKKEKMNIKTMP